jgi:hypothetical protein
MLVYDFETFHTGLPPRSLGKGYEVVFRAKVPPEKATSNFNFTFHAVVRVGLTSAGGS